MPKTSLSGRKLSVTEFNLTRPSRGASSQVRRWVVVVGRGRIVARKVLAWCRWLDSVTQPHTHTAKHTHTQTQPHTDTATHTHTDTQPHSHTHTHTQTHSHTDTHTDTHTHTHTETDTHRHTHTHT